MPENGLVLKRLEKR